MDTAAIAIAFLLGFLGRQIGLPPLVGYLAAGFALHAMGVRSGHTIEVLSELGITLLLFTIGLKLRLGTLLRPEVWAVSTTHMALIIGATAPLLFLAGAWAITSLSTLPVLAIVLIAFSLSFSSTVFAVKVLEGRGEMAALHGRIAIGVLVVQDIFAVAYLAIAEGKVPSVYAIGLLGLPFLRPYLFRVMHRCGHGELLVLFGLMMAFGGAELFELGGVEGGVGALVLGILLASHSQAGELFKSLLSFKDMFLIGFFLSIGLSGVPSPESLMIAALLLLLLPLKAVLFFALMVAAKVRTRTAALSSLALANYSEFGLIVAAMAVSSQVLDEAWVVAIAISVAISFVIAAPLNVFAHALVGWGGPWLRRFERAARLPGDEAIDPGEVSVMICGMGRVGSSAYDEMHRRYGDTVVGVDLDEQRVQAHCERGRRVIRADVTDPDFWEKANHHHIQLVMLAMPNHGENLFTGTQLSISGFDGIVLATAQFPDEVAELKAAGVTEAYNLRAEAGVGLAELSKSLYHGPSEGTEPG